MTNNNKYFKYKYKYFNLKNKLNSYIGGFLNEGKLVYTLEGEILGTIIDLGPEESYMLDSKFFIKISDQNKTWTFKTFEATIERLLDELDDLKDAMKKLNQTEMDIKIKEIESKQKMIDDVTENRRQNFLKPYTNCDENSITINNFTFSLLAYDPKAYGYRGILIIKSTNNLTGLSKLFPVYSSKSECGFWRLCIATKSSVLIKGDPNTMDYIQGTFIHIDLQKFINNNLCKCYLSDIGNKCFFMDNIIIAYIYKQVTNHKKRGMEIVPFSEYTQVPGNKTGSRAINSEDIIYTNLLTLSRQLEIIPGFESPSFIIDSEYNKRIDIDGDILTIDGHIIRCIFTNGIILYMLIYSLTVETPSCTTVETPSCTTVKKGICPITMIHTKSEITEFGLYSVFVPAGNYIGKLFEYSKQIAGNIVDPLKLGKDYVYIGHRYDGLYPYTVYLSLIK